MEIILKDIEVGSLKKLDMCIFDNQINAIVGPNGSGKSIIAELIATLRKPKSGAYIIDGNKIEKRFREELSVVFQHELDHLNGMLFYDRIDKKNPYKNANKYRPI